MTKNALFVKKFDLCLKILLANNNLDSVHDKAGLADGRTEEKLTGESAIPKTKKKKILLQNHNNLINKQQIIGICNLNLWRQQKQKGTRPGR